MRKFLLPLATVALIALSTLTALAAEPEANSSQKPTLSGNSNSAEMTPTLLKAADMPAFPVIKTQSVTIGIINMAKIAQDSSSGKAAAAEVKAKMEILQKKIKSKEAQLKKQKAAIEAQMPSLAPIQREAKAKEFKKKLESFQKFIQNAEKEVHAKETEMLKKLYESVAKSAADYGKANGFAAIVINKELLYVDNTVDMKDITAQIIKMIDKSGKK